MASTARLLAVAATVLADHCLAAVVVADHCLATLPMYLPQTMVAWPLNKLWNELLNNRVN